MTRRPMIGLVAVAAAVTIALVYVRGLPAVRAADPGADSGRERGPPSSERRRPRSPTPARSPKHEVFGFVPYWEMDDDIADHVAKTPLTTLALFSVTHTKTGAIDTTQTGYKRITGAIGKQLIREAHDRGRGRPARLHELRASRGTSACSGRWRSRTRPIAGLVALADRIGVDGINVDVEQIGVELVPAYGVFVGRLRDALAGSEPRRAGLGRDDRRAGPARRWPWPPAAAGADRIFLMGYDYHYAGSDVGASAPMDRRDGAEQDLRLVARPVRVGRACRSRRRSWACRSTGCAGGWPARSSAPRASATGRSGSRPTTRSSLPTHRCRPSSTRSRSSSSTRSPRRSAPSPATRARPRAGRRSTSIRRGPSTPSSSSPTTAAWRAPGSGRSATNEGIPAYTELMTRFATGGLQ